ncbi:MAG: GlsB/YeaQ/YmgE family stress response membrane protein [Candidatus Binataceae bacterium]
MFRVIIIGLIAGWIAGKLIRGHGYGIIADIVLGLVGAVIGSALFRAVGIAPAIEPYRGLTLLTMATVGAVILVGIAHAIGGNRIPAR